MQDVPVTSNGLSFLIFLVLAPHAFEREKGDVGRTKQVLMDYLTMVSRIRALTPNATWWHRLLEQSVLVAEEYQKTEGRFLKPCSMAKLKEMNQELYDDLLGALTAAAPSAGN